MGPNGASPISRGSSFRKMNEERPSVVRGSTGHRGAWVGPNREGQDGLARRPIVEEGEQRRNGLCATALRVYAESSSILFGQVGVSHGVSAARLGERARSFID